MDTRKPRSGVGGPGEVSCLDKLVNRSFAAAGLSWVGFVSKKDG